MARASSSSAWLEKTKERSVSREIRGKIFYSLRDRPGDGPNVSNTISCSFRAWLRNLSHIKHVLYVCAAGLEEELTLLATTWRMRGVLVSLVWMKNHMCHHLGEEGA